MWKGMVFSMETHNPMNQTIGFAERMERLYPETAAILASYAREMVDSMDDDAMENVNSEDIAKMAGDAASKSGMTDALPTEHSIATISDLSKALVVRELIDRHRRGRGGGRYPYFFPFLFLPYDGYGNNYGYGGYDNRHGHSYDRHNHGYGGHWHNFGGAHRV
jgi:hypothetical protein